MPWETLVYPQANKIKKCVKHASTTANEHALHFGNTGILHSIAGGKVSKKMKAGFEEVMYLANYNGGEVGLFFQKMIWLSAHANPSLGEIWVMSVAFEDNTMFQKPPAGSDQDYIDFLDMLNEKVGGPLHTFMASKGVTSLFSVGAIGATPLNKNKEISWLGYVAKGVWQPKYGHWTFMPPITVTSAYVGSNGQTIPPGVLKHWGSGGFVLTQAKFTP
jgi:hypothetical protein